MLFVLVLFVCAWNAVYGQDVNTMMNMPKYDARYDYLDVDALFNSKRLVRNYVDCLINSQRCTPEGKALKSKFLIFHLFRCNLQRMQPNLILTGLKVKCICFTIPTI